MRDGTVSPQGLTEGGGSLQVLGGILDSVLLQQFAEFLLEGAAAMMVFLRADILLYRLQPAGADTENRIPLLPLELAFVAAHTDDAFLTSRTKSARQ